MAVGGCEDGAARYLRACAERDVEPALELLAALRAGGDVECCLAHRIHPLLDDAVAAVAEGVEGRAVRVLDFEGNAITHRGAHAVAQLISANSGSLVSVKLGENAIGDAGCASVAAAVAGCRVVEKLDLRSNRIARDGAAAVADMLRANRSVAQLFLQKNGVDDAACARLAHGLRGNFSVKHLSLRFNDIGDVGMAELVGALHESGLHSIDLGGNRIHGAGVSALARYLAAPGGQKTLKKVNLRSNSAGPSGGAAVAWALASGHCEVAELFLGFNGIPLDVAVDVLRAAAGNASLKKLDLQGVLLDRTAEDALVHLVERNATLAHLVVEVDETDVDMRRVARGLLRNTALLEFSAGGGGDGGELEAAPLVSRVLRCNRLLDKAAAQADLGRLVAALAREREGFPLLSDAEAERSLEAHEAALAQALQQFARGAAATPEPDLAAGHDIVSKSLARLSGSSPGSRPPSASSRQMTPRHSHAGAPQRASPAHLTPNPHQLVLSQQQAAADAAALRQAVAGLVDAVAPPPPSSQPSGPPSPKSRAVTPSTVAAAGRHPLQQQPSPRERSSCAASSVDDLPLRKSPLPSPPRGYAAAVVVRGAANGRQGAENAAAPSEMLHLLQALQKQADTLSASQTEADQKVKDIISVLGHSLDLTAGEALRDQANKALATAEAVESKLNALLHAGGASRADAAGEVTNGGGTHGGAGAATAEKMNSLELAIAEMAKKVAQALGKQEEALRALQEAVTETRNDQEVIGTSAEQALRFVQLQQEELTAKVDGLSTVNTTHTTANTTRTEGGKLAERLELLEESAKWNRSRLEAVETENAHTIQAQSSHRLKLDSLSKLVDELQPATERAAKLEHALAECKAANSALAERVRSVEQNESRYATISTDLKDLAARLAKAEHAAERHQAAAGAWNAPVQDVHDKAERALAESQKAAAATDRLTHTVKNMTSEWCEGLASLRPKVEELRGATEGNQELKLRLFRLEESMSAGGSASARDKAAYEALSDRVDSISRELQQSQAKVQGLQSGLTAIVETTNEAKAAQAEGMQALQQQLRILATEVQKIATQQEEQQRDRDAGSASQQQQQPLGSLGDVLQREELARELALLRKEAQEAHALTNELRKKLHERSVSPAPADTEKVAHLCSRVELLEEVVKRDQQASVIALEAILAERRGTPMTTLVAGMPHGPPSPRPPASRPATPPAAAADRRPANQPPTPPPAHSRRGSEQQTPTAARHFAMREMEAVTHQILSARGIAVPAQPSTFMQHPHMARPTTPLTGGAYSR